MVFPIVEYTGISLGDDKEVRETAGRGRHLAEHGSVHENTQEFVTVTLHDSLYEIVNVHIYLVQGPLPNEVFDILEMVHGASRCVNVNCFG